MGKVPVNNLINSLSPFIKTPTEIWAGKSAFPDFTKPSIIRDPAQHAASSLGVKAEYDLLAGKPTSNLYDESWMDAVQGLRTVKSDETAYYRTLDLKRKFEKEKGATDAEGFYISDKSNALYNYKMSLRNNNAEAAKKYMDEYIELGGTKEGYLRSMQSLSPTAGLGEYKDEFINSLTEKEKVDLDTATKLYNQMLSNTDSRFYSADYVKNYTEFGEKRSMNDKKYKKMKDGAITKDSEVIKDNTKINYYENVINKVNAGIKAKEKKKLDTTELEKIKLEWYKRANKELAN
jgi:hypothetical protein